MELNVFFNFLFGNYYSFTRRQRRNELMNLVSNFPQWFFHGRKPGLPLHLTPEWYRPRSLGNVGQRAGKGDGETLGRMEKMT